MFILFALSRLFGLIDESTWNTFLITSSVDDAAQSIGYHIDKHDANCERRNRELIEARGKKNHITKRIRRGEVREGGKITRIEEIVYGE